MCWCTMKVHDFAWSGSPSIGTHLRGGLSLLYACVLAQVVDYKGICRSCCSNTQHSIYWYVSTSYHMTRDVRSACFIINCTSLSPCDCFALFSLNNMQKGGLKQHNFIDTSLQHVAIECGLGYLVFESDCTKTSLTGVSSDYWQYDSSGAVCQSWSRYWTQRARQASHDQHRHNICVGRSSMSISSARNNNLH